jgi:hypothetical protein
LLITCVAYRFHVNLSSATSLQLFLVTAIALRWGFFEAGIVSLFPLLASITSSPNRCSSSTWRTPRLGCFGAFESVAYGGQQSL